MWNKRMTEPWWFLRSVGLPQRWCQKTRPSPPDYSETKTSIVHLRIVKWCVMLSYADSPQPHSDVIKISRNMLTLSERGDIWHLLEHIKHLSCLPERKYVIIAYIQSIEKWIITAGSHWKEDMHTQTEQKDFSDCFHMRHKINWVQPLDITGNQSELKYKYKSLIEMRSFRNRLVAYEYDLWSPQWDQGSYIAPWTIQEVSHPVLIHPVLSHLRICLLTLTDRAKYAD